jgi:hypothetical protein
MLKVSSVPHTSVLLLALAASIGQIFLIILSLIALRNVAPGLSRALLEPVRDGCLAAIAAGTAAYGVLSLGGEIAPLTTLVAVFTQGLVAGIVGLATAALALYLLKNKEFQSIVDAVVKLVHLGARSPNVLKPSAEEQIQP